MGRIIGSHMAYLVARLRRYIVVRWPRRGATSGHHMGVSGTAAGVWRGCSTTVGLLIWLNCHVAGLSHVWRVLTWNRWVV